MGCKIIATDEGDTRLLLPSNEARNAAEKSRDPSAFLDAMRVAFADETPSDVNASFVRDQHNLSRFSKYFLDFVND